MNIKRFGKLENNNWKGRTRARAMEIYSTKYSIINNSFLVLQLSLESNFCLLYEPHYFPTSQVPKKNSLSFLKNGCHGGTITEISKNYLRLPLFHCLCTVNLVLLPNVSRYLSDPSPLLHSHCSGFRKNPNLVFLKHCNSLFLIGRFL